MTDGEPPLPRRRPAVPTGTRTWLLILGIVATLVGLVTVIRQTDPVARSEEELRRMAPDLVRADAMVHAIVQVYEYDGDIINNMSDLAHSSYYPFQESPGLSCLGRPIFIRIS